MISMTIPNLQRISTELMVLHAGPQHVRMVPGILVLVKLRNATDNAGASFSWQQPASTAYNMPHNAFQGSPYPHTYSYAESPDQERPQNPHVGGGSHPSRYAPMQSLYTTTDQRVQRSSVPQRVARTSHDQLNSHGIQLRPVSDLRMLFCRG